MKKSHELRFNIEIGVFKIDRMSKFDKSTPFVKTIRLKKLITILFSFFLIGQLQAQIPNFNTGGSGGIGDAPKQNANFKTIFPDSVPVHFFYLEQPETWYKLDDTLLLDFHQYDPTRQLPYFDEMNLGDIGLPTKPLLYQPIIREGFHLGFNQYRLYQWQNDKIRYFETPKPYTEAIYTQTGSQDEFTLEAVASINLSKNIKASLDFRRIRQDGQYQRQALKHGNFSATAMRTSKDKRLRTYFSYLTNNIFQQHNGGVQNVTDIGVGGIFSSRSGLSVNLSGAETDYSQNIMTLTNYYSLTRAPEPPESSKQDTIPRAVDTLSFRPKTPPLSPSFVQPPPTLEKTKKADLLLMHQLVYETINFKFFDISPPTDSAIYGDFMVDERGLRHSISYRAIENKFKVRLAYMGNLDVGIRHKIFFVNQEPKDTTINNLFLMGDWNLDTNNDNFGLNVKARFGLLDNGTDYLVDANAFLSIPNIGRLDGRLVSQRYSPSLLQHRMYISQREMWNNTFAKPIETTLMASLHIPKTKTTFHFQNHLINNFIYYDTTGTPAQATGAVNILQFLISQPLKFKALHFNNTIGVQQVSNSELLNYPSFVSKHSLYLEGGIFRKAALVQFGIDARYNTGFQADNFQPATGQFYLQNQTTVSRLPIFDIYFSTKVKTFRGFIKVENVNEAILNETVEGLVDTYFPSWNFNPTYYTLQSPQYPMRSWSIRFGVHWRFYD